MNPHQNTVVPIIGLLACVALFLPGCAPAPQLVWLAPLVNVPSSAEGNRVAVAVRTVDNRPSSALGYYGATREPATEMTTSQDIAAIVRQEILVGLRKKGFVPVNEAGIGEVRLMVEVSALDYSTTRGELTDKVDINGVLKAVATKSNKHLEKTYRIVNTEKVLLTPSAETNARWINGALSDVLRQLLEDKELSAFLAN